MAVACNREPTMRVDAVSLGQVLKVVLCAVARHVDGDPMARGSSYYLSQVASR
jgi:hypothetical protein